MNLNTSSSFTNSGFSGFIGVAEADITPPAGIYVGNWGASTFDTARGIHRPLKLTCITFQKSLQEDPLILFSADLGFWKNKEDEQLIRKGILEELSLDASRLMFCLTHTHAGPSIYSKEVSQPGGDLIEPYLSKVKNTAIRMAKSGLEKAIAATLTWGYGKCNLATNRDLLADDGKRFIVGFNPDQSADDTLLVGRVTDQKDPGRTIATLVNYACHPTTLGFANDLISPDYVGAMKEVVESHTTAPCLFLQGASGELAPAEQYVREPGVADKHGFQLGYAVLSTLYSMLPPDSQLSFDGVVESGAPLATWKREKYNPPGNISVVKSEVTLPLKDLPGLLELEEQISSCQDGALKERLWRLRGIRESFGDGHEVPIPLWIWQLGDSFLVGQQNELYSKFQMELRSKFSNAIAVIGLVNGTGGYLVPSELYTEKRYQVWQTPFDKGSFERIQEEALKEIKGMSL